MQSVALGELPGELDTIYRSGITLAFIRFRDVESVIDQIHSVMVPGGWLVWSTGPGRPLTVAGGALPPNFRGLTADAGGWAAISQLGQAGWPGRTVGILTTPPLADLGMQPILLDALRAYLPASRGTPLLLAMVAEQIPAEFARLGPVVGLRPPSQDEREGLLTTLAAKNRFPVDPAAIRQTAQNLSGLDLGEIKQIGLLQLLRYGGFDPAKAGAEKAARLAEGGFLEPITTPPTPVGGLAGLKRWLQSRAAAVAGKGLPMPQGCVLVGPPGTGKSLSAQLVAQTFALPLMRLDVGRLMGSYVGESEKNLRAALAQTAALAPSVLWIDEIEKGLAGASGAQGSEITRRLLQTLLTWMQEQRGTFVFATANDITALPPELLRKGRFDEVFYCDLPTEPERADIWAALLTQAGLDAGAARELARASVGYTGAEMFAALQDARYECAAPTPGAEDILLALQATKPLSQVAPDAIAAIRSWGVAHARPAGGSAEPAPASAPAPRLRG